MDVGTLPNHIKCVLCSCFFSSPILITIVARFTTTDIAGALLSFNKRKKSSDRSSQGEGLVAKGNQERGRNKSRSESSRNKCRSKSRRKKNIQCYKCGKKGHIKRECP